MYNIILVSNILLNTIFYFIDFGIIPHFGNPRMSYEHDIMNLG